MPHGERLKNHVKRHRTARGWSQDELARRAGISRTEVSAIEIQRVIPSVSAALALAAALETRVEDLFGDPRSERGEPTWAWPPMTEQCRFWQAEVAGRTLWYPVETSELGIVGHDGIFREGRGSVAHRHAPERTLVMASCDPAAGLLATALAASGDFRLLVVPRSSAKALELLGAGLVHLAGVHLSKAAKRNDNVDAVRERLGTGYNLVHVARWTEGVAVAPGHGRSTIRKLVDSKLRWVGREPGSGARQCLDEILEGRPAPKRQARDHRGVAEAIRCGWADAGVCLQLVSEESGLDFLSVRDETYDLCFRAGFEADPRLGALLQVLRSAAYRKTLGELPGYDVSHTGEITRVEANGEGS